MEAAPCSEAVWKAQADGISLYVDRWKQVEEGSSETTGNLIGQWCIIDGAGPPTCWRSGWHPPGIGSYSAQPAADLLSDLAKWGYGWRRCSFQGFLTGFLDCICSVGKVDVVELNPVILLLKKKKD